MSTEMMYPNQEDRCPLCGSYALDYPDGMQIDNMYVFCSTSCCDCGATWVQRYSLIYDENTGVMDKNGMEVDE